MIFSKSKLENLTFLDESTLNLPGCGKDFNEMESIPSVIYNACINLCVTFCAFISERIVLMKIWTNLPVYLHASSFFPKKI